MALKVRLLMTKIYCIKQSLFWLYRLGFLRKFCVNNLSIIKITTPDKIRQLVSVQLPGIELKPLVSAPRQLPYHAGYTYFHLDTGCDDWLDVQRSHSIAFHVAGDFPELDMQLWAIRG